MRRTWTMTIAATVAVVFMALSAQAADPAPPSAEAEIVILKPSADWIIQPPGAELPMALANLKNVKTGADVDIFVFPIGDEGVIGAGQGVYRQMKEGGLSVEPLHEAEDGTWAYFRFSLSNGTDQKLCGKVFLKAFATAPGLMIMATGAWPEVHDAAMVHDLDYLVATAHVEHPKPSPEK